MSMIKNTNKHLISSIQFNIIRYHLNNITKDDNLYKIRNSPEYSYRFSDIFENSDTDRYMNLDQ